MNNIEQRAKIYTKCIEHLALTSSTETVLNASLHADTMTIDFIICSLRDFIICSLQ